MTTAALARTLTRLETMARQRTAAEAPLLDRLRRDPAAALTSAGLTPDRWQKAFQLNLFSTFNVTQPVLARMVERRAGSIVSIASDAGFGEFRMADYGAMKAGVLAFTRTIAKEYGRYGIRVNTMAPGGTEVTDRVTPRQFIRPGVMADEGDAAQAEDYRREMAQDIRHQQAVQRRGLPEEQAAAIAFLASDDASFITGQVINCSGGQS